MDKTEQAIINIMKALYNINIEKENDLKKSFLNTSKKDKEDILIILVKAYQNNFDNNKKIFSNFKKIGIGIDEFYEQINVDDILKQIK